MHTEQFSSTIFSLHLAIAMVNKLSCSGDDQGTHFLTLTTARPAQKVQSGGVFDRI